MSRLGLWVARLTVGGMTTTRIHTCTYFDDGGAEHLCACGSRAFYLAEEDGAEAVLVVLDDGPPVTQRTVGSFARELAISA
jgi:hypothetical protein